MDIFEKCYKSEVVQVAKTLISNELYPYFHTVESGQDPEVIIEGKKMIMMGSNNYLGLTSHWRLKAAVINATRKYGVGCVGSRFLNGTLDIHVKLENEIAQFINENGKDNKKALLFSTGMQTNFGAIAALVSRHEYAIIDEYDHASIYDGCQLAKAYGAKWVRFKHNDMADLEQILKTVGFNTPKLIIVDGVYSMEGDIANLPGIVELAKKYNARVMVDDAHGIGVLGRGGRGTASQFGLTDKVDIIMGTFSKSLASIGGFIAADEDIIFYLKHLSRILIFTASPSPSNVASVRAALKIINSITGRRRIKQLWRNTQKMRAGFKSLGFDTGTSTTPIIPIIVGENERAFTMWKLLYEQGVFTTPIVAPATPPGRALIRVSIMATHTAEQLDKALAAFETAGRKLGLIDTNQVWIKKKRYPIYPPLPPFNMSKMRQQLKNWMAKLWR
ncbi:MAG: pyridoxal phosphate-dependent aminotransferase family protein [Elusimicrobiota bacterium]